MAHYRTIEVEGVTYRYVVGSYRTKVNIVDPDGSATSRWTGLFYNSDIGTVYSEDRISVQPSHIERAIRRVLKIPQRQYDWDKPAAKKDSVPKTRGFRNLIGAKIVDVRVSAINEVILEGADGARYAIETGLGAAGMSTIFLRTLTNSEDEG